MPADESQALRQVLRRLDHGALRTPHIGDDRLSADALHEIPKGVDVLTDGSRQHDEVSPRRQGKVIAPGIGRLETHRPVDDRLAVDRNDSAGRPRLP
jgi:hypothetical protein